MAERSYCEGIRIKSFQVAIGTGTLLLAMATVQIRAAEYFVSSAAQISSVMATAQPGDVLTMLDGNWTNQRIQFAGVGTSSAPITLRAQTPGQVLLNGNSKINISGDWLVVDGLRFEGRVARPPTRASPTRQSSTTTRPASTPAIFGSPSTAKTIASITITSRTRTIPA
jgi:hypothetical protein